MCLNKKQLLPTGHGLPDKRVLCLGQHEGTQCVEGIGVKVRSWVTLDAGQGDRLQVDKYAARLLKTQTKSN